MKKRSRLVLVIVFISVFLITLSIPNLIFADTRSDVEAFVTRFYNSCLDRDPDLPGLENWVGYLQSGELSGGDVAERFIFSEEFLAKNLSNEEFLNIMYWSFFGRNPDAEGYAGWLSQLNDGMSRKSVLARFVNSTEFGNICAEYGIERGSIGDTDTNRDRNRDRDDDEGNLSYGNIRGSDVFITYIVSALDLLRIYDPTVYSQFAEVDKIEAKDLSGYGAAGYSGLADGEDVYIDPNCWYFRPHSYVSDTDRTKIIAMILSHEFNHVMNKNFNYNIAEQWQCEIYAVGQEIQTGIKIGAPQWMISDCQDILANISNPETWWWYLTIPIPALIN